MRTAARGWLLFCFTISTIKFSYVIKSSNMKPLSLPISTGPRPAAIAVLVAMHLPGVLGHSAKADQGGPNTHKVDKLDTNLRHAVDHDGDGLPRRVIVRVDPAAVSAMEGLLKGRGDKLIRFHRGISAFTVRSQHLEALADNPAVLSISVDAPLEAHAIVTPTTFLPTQQVVRDSVSVKGTWTGAGVGWR